MRQHFNHAATADLKAGRIRVMIVDDQPDAREALKSKLAAEPCLQVVAALSSGQAAIEQVSNLLPDVVLMDIHMPEMDGLTATYRLKQKYPACEVLVLTSSEDQAYLRQALYTGACGYILKTLDQQSLVEAIKTVAEGGALINPLMLRELIQDYAARPASNPANYSYVAELAEQVPVRPTILNNLTRREREVLTLIGQGYSNTIIGRQLNISPETVKSHVRSILDKLDVRDRTQAAVFAVRSQLA